MAKKWRPVLVGVLALALLSGGLVTGWALSAQAGPGDAEDPLVAKSYVDQLVKEQTVSLHNQIVVLNQRIEVLQKALAETGKEINLPAMPADYQNVVWTATTPGSGNSGGSGSVNQPAPPAAETKQTA
ncbi:MAG: hypothetical protein PHC60_10290, partial [Heliobacteriaceae bacterium]|nr:hypothetical protein [Heliobacteriaceae bacterium]